VGRRFGHSVSTFFTHNFMTNKRALLLTFSFFGTLLIVLFSVVAYAAPVSNVLGNILPISNGTYDIGSTTPSAEWKNIFTQNITVSGTCTGCGALSGGTAGWLTYWTSATVVSATSSPSVTSLTAGYLTATSTTASTFAGSITAAGGLTLTCTACLTDTNVADDITLTNITQITNRAITDLTGTLTVGNGGTGQTSFTSSQLLYGNGSLALSSVATTSLTATSPLSLSQPISVIGGSASALSLSTAGDWTGTLDLIEGASFLRSDASDNYTSGTLTLDAGTSFVSNITGTSTWAGGLQTTAINATTGTSTFIGIQANCIKNALGGCITTEANRSILVASSTLAYNGAFGTAGTTTLIIANSVKATTLTNIFCKTDTGTAHIQFSDGTNKTDVLACVTGGTADDGSIANNTWTSREDFDLEVGSSINTPNRITITIKLRED